MGKTLKFYSERVNTRNQSVEEYSLQNINGIIKEYSNANYITTNKFTQRLEYYNGELEQLIKQISISKKKQLNNNKENTTIVNIIKIYYLILYKYYFYYFISDLINLGKKYNKYIQVKTIIKSFLATENNNTSPTENYISIYREINIDDIENTYEDYRDQLIDLVKLNISEYQTLLSKPEKRNIKKIFLEAFDKEEAFESTTKNIENINTEQIKPSDNIKPEFFVKGFTKQTPVQSAFGLFNNSNSGQTQPLFDQKSSINIQPDQHLEKGNHSNFVFGSNIQTKPGNKQGNFFNTSKNQPSVSENNNSNAGWLNTNFEEKPNNTNNDKSSFNNDVDFDVSDFRK